MKRADKIKRKLASRRKDYDLNIQPKSNIDGEYTRPGSLKLKG